MNKAMYCPVTLCARPADMPAAPATMRAVTFDRYGDLDVLRPGTIATPAVADDQVRVRVHAAAVHIGDCFTVRGAPFAVRFATGLLRPKHGVPGFDFAGIVDAVGAGVTRVAPGDAVYGASAATCAEYACAGENQLAPKPADLSFAEAAALPTSGLAALHALRDVAAVAPGQRVLINGASGGVGHFAIQIARAYGAEVTAVCSGRNAAMVRSLGADHVIDYTTSDFADGSRRYDVIFDNIENRPLAECRRALTPSGTLVLNSGTGATGLAMLARLVAPLVVSPFVGHNLRRYLSVPNRDDLLALTELVDDRAVTPVIDRTYPLEDTADALRYLETGRARGKVIIAVRE